ncbi:uncharacterized protein [Triticum aestivum]|uniref:uncharacterized protein n=1 Tax=Triticum aestivum TaxID=4565 RepID=UPI001D01A547|nr:uncharacterized protein LOC123082882 [Triticum aestivum]
MFRPAGSTAGRTSWRAEASAAPPPPTRRQGQRISLHRTSDTLSQRHRRPSLPLQVEELLFQFVRDPYGVVGDVALRELVLAVVGWVGKLDQILEVVLSHILASAQPAAWHMSLRHH